MMSDGILLKIPQVIRTYNVTRSISRTTTEIYSASIRIQTAIPITKSSDISPAECFGFAILILTTIIGNTLVLSALFLDKRLHTPSFFLIANMAIADLLLGIAVLPFSSVLELLNDHWIFGQSFCSTWLALDVLCCTASIIALMAVSIDRYIGVTRPLNYSTIMTTRRTIYLIIIVWTVSILTSVVPLFGLTDRRKISKNINTTYEHLEKCEVNKNTFYTIFSSMISFYIPVIILLILYSRVYQEAKKQEKKLESEKRRLFEIDYQRAHEQAQKLQKNQSNGNLRKSHSHSNKSEDSKNGVSRKILNHENSVDHTLPLADSIHLKNDYSDLKSKDNADDDDDISQSESSMAPKKKRKRGFFGKRIFSTIKRNSLLSTTTPQTSHRNSALLPNDELLLIKRRLHNLKREKKAFRTVGLILGALLICWLPFFVTLPVMSILKHHGVLKDEKHESTWFKIAFWLGYCNSALNPFVYAFSNRAIRRAFRQVIFRRCCCCCICPKPSNNPEEQHTSQRQRGHSGSLTTDISQVVTKGINSSSVDTMRTIPRTQSNHNYPPSSLRRTSTTAAPIVSFADFLEETGDDDISSHDDKQSIKEDLESTSNSKIDK
ncbi:unnamed protein product [Adineta steineri]|uniref:G-protein coupled receptors family 1 profile domain-containing protein n=2 Tax=Adineta steineri TaxID=433720 RepID=A0A819PU15_9BILA|nr:unnamed protein product [Adineta steineri]CAF4014512.1 unnamed protein product [Adineta steineri]